MNNEIKFREYLNKTKNQQGNNFTEHRINTFIKILKDDLPKKLTQLGEITNSLLETEDNNYLSKLKRRCLKDGDLHLWNQSISSMEPSSALLNYMNFLFFKNNIDSDNYSNLNSMNIKNITLYGAPGVGKTHNYKNLISMIEEGRSQKEIFDTIAENRHVELDNDTFEVIKQEKRVEFITFHQSYSYEDFIEGFRPNKSGNIELEDGIFKKLCGDAEKSDKNFYIVIDEINRGNISKIFGELITLIEEDKRDTYEVTLPYSKEKFKVPSNLYIIATMNSTDKSIATIDIALRRRFTFLKMKPNAELIIFPHAKILFNSLNKFIKEKLGEDYQLGHSYFMKIESNEDLDFVKEYKIKPLLEEYFYADDGNLDKVIKILEEYKEVSNE